MFYLLALLILSVSWWLPWWIFAPLSYIAGLNSTSHRQAILTGLLGVGLAWLMTLYYLDLKSYGRVSDHLAGLFSLPSGGLMIVLNALLGGLVGSICAEAGFLWRNKKS